VILLVGSRDDPPLRAVARSLQHAGADCVCLDGDVRVVTSWRPGSEAVLATRDRRIPLEQVQSAYLRPFGLSTGADAARRALETLLAWADATPARILNPPAASVPNNSKPLQSQSIARFGLRSPETLVTTDAAAVRDFVRRHGHVVYKSISGVRSIVSRLGGDCPARLDDVANCPTQFQQYIPGDDVRVHVMGDVVHALRITSGCDDYRYAARQGGRVEAAAIELDVVTADVLRTMVRRMGLWVAGVDLRLTPAGEIYCLEVNPSPGFTYYEDLAGVPLAPHIAALLLQAA
jgi:glutathione synthase/RimK-type ligase-like ATP-grasp enzyme